MDGGRRHGVMTHHSRLTASAAIGRLAVKHAAGRQTPTCHSSLNGVSTTIGPPAVPVAFAAPALAITSAELREMATRLRVAA